MIKIAHESPKSIFKQVQQVTDYDYALVHLFEKDPEYLNLFKEAVASGREVILDNSVFELETAFDPERFVYWINELNPTYYIVPDVLEDASGTMKNMVEWHSKWLKKVKTGSKIIGVVQGSNYEMTKRCYAFMDEVGVDKIAISFDYSWFKESVPYPNHLLGSMLARVKLLGDLKKDQVLNTNKPHHLLGCYIPGEGIFYQDPEFDYIDSMDTSNPVLHGCLGIEYKGTFGLTYKDPTKLYTIMDSKVDENQWKTVQENIQKFRAFWNGK